MFLELKYIVALFYIVVFLMPFSSNKKIRYYGVYMFYVLYVSTFGFLLVPIFILRPKNVVNLTIAGIIYKRFTKVMDIEWSLVKGKELLGEKKGAIIVANHQSILDIMGMWNIWEVMGKCTAIAKREIMYVFPFGPIAWLAGLVYIDRGSPKKAVEQLKKTSRLIREENTKLWLYPEGTRNDSGKLLPFKKGAFRMAIECQVPILPVVFSPYYFIDSKNKTCDSKGQMYVSALGPVSTENLTLDDIDSLMEKVHEMMQKEYDSLKTKIPDHKSR